jgi:hypothetical protein
MAFSLSSPWIAKHLVNIAEEYGGNLQQVPKSERCKKVQVTEVRD